jgi:hypothetical protein
MENLSCFHFPTKFCSQQVKNLREFLFTERNSDVKFKKFY